ncbi:MAG: hypothetical protein WC125_07035 [Bacteroidales bacterium]
MHETYGDGYIIVNGKRVYADEDPGVRDATQFRFNEANSFQEEIANVIRAEGITLNDHSEDISQMNQLNTAIDNKVSNEASDRASADLILDGRVDDLETDMADEILRNDTQDADIADLQDETSKIVHTNALKGDVLTYDSGDLKWYPASTRAFKTRLFCEAMKKGLASQTHPGAEYQITDVTLRLKGRYATPGDGSVPQGNTLFQTYDLSGAEVEEAEVTAVYHGQMWRIIGNIVFITPASISNGYGGYTTSIYQALQISCAIPQMLWYGPLDYWNHNGVGRSYALYKRFASSTDNVRYAGDETGELIAMPYGVGNAIWIGSKDTWFYHITRDDARSMPAILLPSRKYAISFDVMAPAAIINNYEYPT